MNRPRNELLLGLFDCLVEVEREALERRLAASESARRTVREVERLAIEWSSDRASHPSPPALERLAGGTAPPRADAEDLAHLLECRDCAFEVSILRAGADEPRGSASGDPGRRSGRRWPLLAAAALVAATLAGVGGFRLGQRAAGAVPPTAVSVPIDLDAVRGSAESPELRLSELEVDGITVLASLRVPEGGAGWRLVREDGAVIASEALRFDPSVPRVRRVAVLVPRDRLSRGLWTFEAVAPDGAVSGRWWIRIRD